MRGLSKAPWEPPIVCRQGPRRLHHLLRQGITGAGHAKPQRGFHEHQDVKGGIRPVGSGGLRQGKFSKTVVSVCRRQDPWGRLKARSLTSHVAALDPEPWPREALVLARGLTSLSSRSGDPDGASLGQPQTLQACGE